LDPIQIDRNRGSGIARYPEKFLVAAMEHGVGKPQVSAQQVIGRSERMKVKRLERERGVVRNGN